MLFTSCISSSIKCLFYFFVEMFYFFMYVLSEEAGGDSLGEAAKCLWMG
jgi:hypothetical protein